MRKKDLPQKLKIAFVSPKFTVSGAAVAQGFVWPILRQLALMGHTVHIYAWSNSLGEPLLVIDGVHIYFLSELHKTKNILDYPKLVQSQFLAEHEKDPYHIMHSLAREGYLLATQRIKHKFSTAFDIQATSMGQLFSYIGMAEDTVSSKIKNSLQISYTFLKTYLEKDRALLKVSDAAFVTSPQQKTILERYYLYPQIRIHTIPYSIDLHDLSVRQKSDSLRKKLNIPLNCRIAVTATDMIDKTEMTHILKAFQKVAVKKPNTRLIVMGHGPHFKAIEFEMLNLALGSKVIFVGAIPQYEVHDYIDLADAFINLSSRSTGFEPTSFEAMAQQKIVISSEVSSLANIIDNTSDGFLIRPADIHSLSELLIDIFSYTANYQNIGDRARQKVLSLFDLKKLTQQTLDSYMQTLSLTRRYSKNRSQEKDMRP